MTKRTNKQKKRRISIWLASILMAVVFVLGTMLVPAELYAAEGTTSGAQAAAAAAEAAVNDTQAAADEITSEQGVAGAGEAESVSVEEAAAEGADAAETDAAETEATETAAEESEEVIEDAENDLSEMLTVDLDGVDETTYDGFLYKLEDSATNKEVKEMETAIDELPEDQEVSEVVGEELYAADSLETIEEVAGAEMVEYIEPNYFVEALGTNDPYYNERGWYLEMIKAPYIWERGMFGSGVTVAVLDSGVNLSHPDFEYTDFTAQYNAINDTEDMTDNSGHGSAVVGIIAASYNNGKGLTGITPDATVMPVKVMDLNTEKETVGTMTDVIKGLDYAVNNGAEVINMSFGGTRDSLSLKNACQSAAAKGAILVAAAGNDGTGTVEYPASYDSVISVGSVEKDENHSDFSTYNKYVDVAAPGRGIHFTGKRGGYGTTTGTSFATPQIAAMAVLVKSMDPSVNVSGFRSIIASTARDLGPAGRDHYFGYGIMDLSRTYRYMAGEISMYPMSLSSASYVYNGGVKTPSVVIRKAGRVLSSNYYTTAYSSGRKAVGTYKVTVKGREGYTGSKTLSYKIVPPLVKSIKAPKRLKKKLTVRWKSMSKSQKKKYNSAITGYQVRVATNANFSNAKYKKVKGISKTSVTVKGLKKKTTYYVQYRAYKVVGSTTYYSKWSAKKKTKTK